MKFKTSLILIFLFFLQTQTIAQNYNSRTFFQLKKINFPYFDIGGMFLPTSTSTYNLNLGFGYQFHSFLGVGLSYSNASSWDPFRDKFNGFGLDYRMQTKNWWVKNTVGIINKYFPSQKSVFVQPIKGEKNKIYYRLALGWIPRGGMVKVGIAYHLTNQGNFESWTCAPGIPDCQFISNGKRQVNNIQFFVGLHFPNPARKSLQRSLLKK